jgi:hypothetical protein
VQQRREKRETEEEQEKKEVKLEHHFRSSQKEKKWTLQSPRDGAPPVSPSPNYNAL